MSSLPSVTFVGKVSRCNAAQQKPKPSVGVATLITPEQTGIIAADKELRQRAQRVSVGEVIVAYISECQPVAGRYATAREREDIQRQRYGTFKPAAAQPRACSN